MFFLLPISHEHATVRRWPLLTIAIVALNVFFLIVSLVFGSHARDEAASAASRVEEFSALHPKAAASAPPSCGVVASPTTTSLLDQIDPRKPGASDEEQDEQDAAEMGRLCANLITARDATLEYRFGYIPARPSLLGLLTHQFMHAGILHLVFNMWFFWLCGCNLEDRWGRLIFPGFYLLAGVAGALVHAHFTQTPEVPLIGASGAIAGAMGAFLGVLGATRIRFFYAYMLTLKPKWGTFEAAAYWMLPLWLLSELFEALVFSDEGTAHWAHVGGFVFGLVVGGVMKLSGLDAKLDAGVEESITTRQDPRLIDAASLTDQQRFPEAIQALDDLAREDPENVDVLVELLRAVTSARNLPRRMAESIRLMHAYLSKGYADAAADVYGELRLHNIEGELTREDAARLGEAFARRQKVEQALFAFRQAQRGGLMDLLAVRACVSEATLLARSGRATDARKLFDECKASPFLTVELEQKVEAQLAALGPAAIAMGEQQG